MEYNELIESVVNGLLESQPRPQSKSSESENQPHPQSKEAEDEPRSAPNCPSCSGQGNFLGSLGKLDHFRCQGCGSDFAHDINEAAYDRYDIVGAHYLWNSHHHGGKSSPEYAKLSKMSNYYKPGLSVRNDNFENENQEEIYNDLCRGANCQHGEDSPGFTGKSPNPKHTIIKDTDDYPVNEVTDEVLKYPDWNTPEQDVEKEEKKKSHYPPKKGTDTHSGGHTMNDDDLTKDVSMSETKESPCPSCKGSGEWDKNGQKVPCPDCNGRGKS